VFWWISIKIYKNVYNCYYRSKESLTEITSKVTEQERRETRRLSVDLTSEMLAEYVQQESKVRDLELSWSKKHYFAF
jgi:hypothetical protein